MGHVTLVEANISLVNYAFDRFGDPWFMVGHAEWSSAIGFKSTFDGSITEVQSFGPSCCTGDILIKVTQGLPWFTVIKIGHNKVWCFRGESLHTLHHSPSL